MQCLHFARVVLFSIEPDKGTHSEHVAEPVAKPGIHPAVDHGIVAGIAHGQPVAGYPDHVDVLELEDDGGCVTQESDGVQGQPAHGVYNYHCDHHLHHLEQQNKNMC